MNVLQFHRKRVGREREGGKSASRVGPARRRCRCCFERVGKRRVLKGSVILGLVFATPKGSGEAGYMLKPYATCAFLNVVGRVPCFLRSRAVDASFVHRRGDRVSTPSAASRRAGLTPGRVDVLFASPIARAQGKQDPAFFGECQRQKKSPMMLAASRGESSNLLSADRRLSIE